MLDEFVDLPQLKQASLFLAKIRDGSAELNSFVEAPPPFCPCVGAFGLYRIINKDMFLTGQI